MRLLVPVATCVEQTRVLLQQSHADLNRFKRGIETSQNAVRRSSQLAQESLRKVRAIKSALIVK